jgi:hypothetical protein
MILPMADIITPAVRAALLVLLVSLASQRLYFF